MLNKLSPPKKTFQRGEIATILTAIILAIITTGIFFGNSLLSKNKITKSNAQTAPTATALYPSAGSKAPAGTVVLRWNISNFTPDSVSVVVDDLDTSSQPVCDPYATNPVVGEGCMTGGYISYTSYWQVSYLTPSFSWTFPEPTISNRKRYKISVILSDVNTGSGLYAVVPDYIINITPSNSICSETDNGPDLAVAGTTSMMDTTGTITTGTDYCTSNVQTEYYCSSVSNGSQIGYQMLTIGTVCTAYGYTGCQNGACVGTPAATNTPIPPTPTPLDYTCKAMCQTNFGNAGFCSTSACPNGTTMTANGVVGICQTTYCCCGAAVATATPYPVSCNIATCTTSPECTTYGANLVCYGGVCAAPNGTSCPTPSNITPTTTPFPTCNIVGTIGPTNPLDNGTTGTLNVAIQTSASNLTIDTVTFSEPSFATLPNNATSIQYGGTGGLPISGNQYQISFTAAGGTNKVTSGSIHVDAFVKDPTGFSVNCPKYINFNIRYPATTCAVPAAPATLTLSGGANIGASSVTWSAVTANTTGYAIRIDKAPINWPTSATSCAQVLQTNPEDTCDTSTTNSYPYGFQPGNYEIWVHALNTCGTTIQYSPMTKIVVTIPSLTTTPGAISTSTPTPSNTPTPTAASGLTTAVTTPNGGETFCTGATVPITWRVTKAATAPATLPTPPYDTDIWVTYDKTTSGTSHWVVTSNIKSDITATSNTTTYQWTAGGVPADAKAGTFKVRVMIKDPVNIGSFLDTDSSNAAFKIVPAASCTGSATNTPTPGITNSPTPTRTPTPKKTPTPTKIPAPTVCKPPKAPKWSPGVVRNNDKLTIGWQNEKDGLTSIVEVCVNGGATCKEIFKGVTPKVYGITKTLSYIKGQDILVQISAVDPICGIPSDIISRPLASGTSTALNTPAVTIKGTGSNKGTSTWIIIGGAFIVVMVVAISLAGM